MRISRALLLAVFVSGVTAVLASNGLAGASARVPAPVQPPGSAPSVAPVATTCRRDASVRLTFVGDVAVPPGIVLPGLFLLRGSEGRHGVLLRPAAEPVIPAPDFETAGLPPGSRGGREE